MTTDPTATDAPITLREHLESKLAAHAALVADRAAASAVLSADRLEALRRELAVLQDRTHERMEANHREIELVQAANTQAAHKAEEAQQLRNEAMNEWRQTVTQIISRYVEQRQLDATDRATRLKIDALEKSLEDNIAAARDKAEGYYQSNGQRLTVVETWKSNMQGRMWGIPMLVGVIVFMLTQLMRVLFPAVR